MLNSIKLLLPALIPSWRFFDAIAPSPRIEFALLETERSTPRWQEFRPRPPHVPPGGMLMRLFWNPRWNETLFLVSCAERLMQSGSEHSSREIITRIAADLAREAAAPHLQFRLVFVSREGERLRKDITFVSPVLQRTV